jgi:hypothetical protein
MITKYLTIIVALASFAGGSFFGSKLLGKKCPDLNCPEIPDCICPKQEPCNGIDFDKIKSRNLTIENKQYLTINGDSLLYDKMRQALKAELEEFKVRKCK